MELLLSVVLNAVNDFALRAADVAVWSALLANSIMALC
jgi:hypothetical protein